MTCDEQLMRADPNGICQPELRLKGHTKEGCATLDVTSTFHNALQLRPVVESQQAGLPAQRLG